MKTSKPVLNRDEAASLRDKAIDAAHALYAKRIAEIERLEAEQPPPARFSQRAERAWELRNEGVGLKEIGAELGCSKARAGQLAKVHERWLERHRVESPFNELSARAANCLLDCGFDLREPELIAEAGADVVGRIHGLGKKSYTEIVVWLRSKGYELS